MISSADSPRHAMTLADYLDVRATDVQLVQTRWASAMNSMIQPHANIGQCILLQLLTTKPTLAAYYQLTQPCEALQSHAKLIELGEKITAFLNTIVNELNVATAVSDDA